jgi:hypothetical protein
VVPCAAADGKDLAGVLTGLEIDLEYPMGAGGNAFEQRAIPTSRSL